METPALDQPESLTERVFKGSTIVLLFSFLGTPLGYLIRVLYSYTLSIEMFGLIYAALALFALISTYLDFGLGFSVSYFIPKFLKKNDQESIAQVFQYYQLTQLVITSIAAVILCLTAPFLATWYFKSPTAINLVYIFSIYLIGNGFFTALNVLFSGFQKELYYSTMQFFRMVSILICSFLFWFFDTPNVVMYALTWLVSTFLVVGCYYVLVLKKYPFVFQPFRWNKTVLMTMATYGFPTLITTTLYTFISSTDAIFLTRFHSVREVGIYSVVFPLATVSSLILSPINTLIFPLISHLMEGEQTKIKYLINYILKLIPFISLYFGLFVALFPTSIAGTLFGGKWMELVEVPLRIFALGFTLAPLSSYLVTILSGMGKVKERLKLSLVLVVANIGFSLLLIPAFDVVGAVTANTLVYLLSIILFTRSISKSFQLEYEYRFYLKLLIFSVLIFMVVTYFQIYPIGWWQIIVAGGIYTAIFGVFGLTQGVLDQKIIDLLSEKYFKRSFKFRGSK